MNVLLGAIVFNKMPTHTLRDTLTLFIILTLFEDRSANELEIFEFLDLVLKML